MSDETGDPQITFKVKSSAEGLHEVTIAESKTVLDLKNLLSGDAYEKIPAARQRLIYSGRVMKDGDLISSYKIKPGNTIHLVKSAASNAAQNPTSPGTAAGGAAASGVPQNMAAGTANNPLAGLTGARYAGHMSLPGMDMFGPDGGMGAGPSEEQFTRMLEDPNTQQMMNEALSNPQMIDMIIQSNPQLRNLPNAREILQSPYFRRMMTDPVAMRQAAAMQRMMQGGGGASSFPAPGVTDNTPQSGAGTGANNNNSAQLPQFPNFGPFGLGGQNPFAAFAPAGQTPVQTPPPPASAGQATPGSATSPPATDATNPFASLFGGAGAGAGGAGPNPFGIAGLPPITPEAMQQAMQFLQQSGGGGLGNLGNLFGAPGAATSPEPADTRPPEERYESQLRQLNDMGFFDFNANVAALRRSGGSVQGAIEQLLNST
ncbi:hypothetical protein B0O99DRAFT_509639 [Bisporella sp. PMI_857]|nr:hypothetical protein B0O99DRAFT_509639 [Bisporella sp. PMI_857]